MKKKYKVLFLIYFFLITIIIFNNNPHHLTTALEYVKCGSANGIPKPIPQITMIGYTLLSIATPLVLIIFSIVTLVKAVSSGQADEIMKAKNKLIKKFITAALIFFVASIVQFVIIRVTSNDNDQESVTSCLKCLLYTEGCVASDSGNNIVTVNKLKTYSNRALKTGSNRRERSHRNSNSSPSSNYNDSSGVKASGNSCGSDKIYSGTRYNLTEAQKKKIAAMVYHEYSGDLVGMKAVASQMANLYEYGRYRGAGCTTSKSFYNYITSPVCSSCCGWYATYKETTYNNLALQAVEDCIINGKRTLPLYIDEFDMFPGDIISPLAFGQYKQGSSSIKGRWGGSGKFWCITKHGSDANLFYYSSDTYKAKVG